VIVVAAADAAEAVLRSDTKMADGWDADSLVSLWLLQPSLQ
jgi:hypothetical protein